MHMCCIIYHIQYTPLIALTSRFFPCPPHRRPPSNSAAVAVSLQGSLGRVDFSSRFSWGNHGFSYGKQCKHIERCGKTY